MTASPIPGHRAGRMGGEEMTPDERRRLLDLLSNARVRLLTGALNDAIRTLRELAEKAAGEPIPSDDLDCPRLLPRHGRRRPTPTTRRCTRSWTPTAAATGSR